MDTITLSGLTFHAYHGYLEAEAELGQKFLVDVSLEVDRLAGSDQLGHTVNYAEVADDVARIVTGEPVRLIETLAQRVAEVCLERPLVRHVTVTIHKPQAPITHTLSDLSVTINRSKDDKRPV